MSKGLYKLLKKHPRLTKELRTLVAETVFQSTVNDPALQDFMARKALERRRLAVAA
jgi:hypothetical protein